LLDKKADQKKTDDASGAKHRTSDDLIHELKIRMGEEEEGGELHFLNWKAWINDIELWAKVTLAIIGVTALASTISRVYRRSLFITNLRNVATACERVPAAFRKRFESFIR